MSRKGRQIASINEKMDKQQRQVNNIDNQVQQLKKQYDEHIISHIVDDLQKERFLGSGKPMFTYAEIGKKYKTSASTVARIADERGLSRRKNKEA